ncbi:MAG: SDR family oxidoreductase [Roseitalea porphyridii]|uniref:SDR family oxidoreductase n=1 Tax=Roseitalea porphyridii TaxID=1852022 RepID=A0A4P6V5Z2_9HYPH|nr:SDR family oxidoreductase [Roseitalea porphyridii]QBK31970.1 SDR family oxidoreductase [Roseitalea porphyridii]
MKLENKIAVVTGGGGGIGRQTCRLLAGEGAKIVVADRVLEDAERTAAELSDAGATAVPMHVEMADDDSIRKLAEQSVERFGHIDILVNNAGARVFGPVTDATLEDWAFILDVNLRGPGLSCKYLIPHMRQGGSIINISSANGVVGRPGMALYDASKAGLLALTRSMACDHADQGIRINAVLPGPTLTDFHIKRAAAEGRELDAGLTRPHDDGPGILRRQGLPEEIAAAVVFLATDDASFVTGACFNIDGGLSAIAQRN